MGRVDSIQATEAQLGILQGLIAQVLPGVKVWAYGSRVKGSARRTSDLDLVAFASASQRRSVEDLRTAFEECDLPFIVDLHVWDELPANFRREIEEQYFEF